MSKAKARAKATPPAPSPPASKPRGSLSNDQKRLIERECGRMSVEHIALQINRSVGQVQRYVDQFLGDRPRPSPRPGDNLVSEIECRPEWQEFTKQYDEEELKHVKYRYVQLMSQFGKDNVLPTEEMQIFSLIRLEIMNNQAMRERKTLVAQQRTLQRSMEAYQEKLLRLEPGFDDHNKMSGKLRDVQSDFQTISQMLKEISNRQSTFATQEKNILENLKATRDQRIKVIEGSGQSFLGFLKALTQEDFRNTKGREMEIMRRAMEKEKARMMAPHVYVDGATDNPLLNHETVDADPEG